MSLVKKGKNYGIGSRPYLGLSNWQRNVLRTFKNRYVVPRLRSQVRKQIKRKAVKQMYRFNKARRLNPRRNYVRIQGRSQGPTYTTTRMIVRKTPRRQRFLRKMFKNNPIKVKHVNRFGFSWMGTISYNKTVWYSVCHLKFNNVFNYLSHAINVPNQSVGAYGNMLHPSATQSENINFAQSVGANPDQFVYIGKCTFNYELYNPTNYLMTVFIYDLVCRKDTPYGISYSDATNDDSNAPENCMYKGSRSMLSNATPSTWYVGDPTKENNTAYNEVGMKPTDYHLFNTLWKVKGVKKIVLPPQAAHHHVVVFNPKKRISRGSLLYPHEKWEAADKNGLAGLTQATLFGFQGQVATEDDEDSDLNNVATLPGKLIVKCVKKVNVWNIPITAQVTISDDSLKESLSKPKIFSDLVETVPMAV